MIAKLYQEPINEKLERIRLKLKVNVTQNGDNESIMGKKKVVKVVKFRLSVNFYTLD